MALEKIPLLEKINKLKTSLYGGEQDDLSQVDSWERDAKQALITANLQEHEAIKMIIDKFTEEVHEIDIILMDAYSTELPDKDRDRLLDSKKFLNKFLQLFETARSTISEIDSRINNELGADN